MPDVVRFGVLHVCMGNICRSPMAERLLTLAVDERLSTLQAGMHVDDLLEIRSAGTGGWHQGEGMNPSAARQIMLRGGSVEGFVARKLVTAHLAEAELILAATADQLDYALALLPEAATRTFVVGHLGRLLRDVDLTRLPPAVLDAASIRLRGRALVGACADLRGAEEAVLEDDIDDPWGRGDQTFRRVADDIDEVMRSFAAALLPMDAKRSAGTDQATGVFPAG